MKKQEMIDILINEYGYEKEDLMKDGRPFTNAVLKSIIDEEEVDEKRMEDDVVVKQRTTYKDDDLIPVMNGRKSSLVHRSLSTGRVWRFERFGVTDKIPYSEIVRLKNNNPKVFDEGWLIILNKQIQDDFKLEDKYKNIVTPEVIDNLFEKNLSNPNEFAKFKSFVKSVPKGMRATVFDAVQKRYLKGDIDSIKLINFIQEEFDTSLDDNAPMSEVAVKAKK